MNDLASPAQQDTLPPGTRLAEFEISRVLGIGGFGVVYLAFDHVLGRQVALKEYMPATLAVRGEGAQVSVRSEAHCETFGVALRSFVNEARLLARFDHPALVKVHRFWEDNGTAYMVMPYYEGRTLRSALASFDGAPDETWLRALIEPLLGALEVLHREQVYHRDIAPDNILLLPDGAPVLLDFGAARHVIADRPQALTAILKPNFAPIEQYGESTQMRQGAWTDIYALGAVLYFCIRGRPPNPAASRALEDDVPPLRSMRDTLHANDGSPYSEALLDTIDAALSFHPQARPQSTSAFRSALDVTTPPGHGPRSFSQDYPKTIAAAPRRGLPGEAADGPSVPSAASDGEHHGASSPHVGTTSSQTSAAPDGPTVGSTDRRERTPKAASFPNLESWAWALRYIAVALFLLMLATALASTNLFESAVLVRRRLNAADLVQVLGSGGALVILWLLARKAALQLLELGHPAAMFHRLVKALALVVILPSAYGVLFPVVRPFLSNSWQTGFKWTFVGGIIAAAGWLSLLLLERAELLGDWARRGARITHSALNPGLLACPSCRSENANGSAFCSRCGELLGEVAERY